MGVVLGKETEFVQEHISKGKRATVAMQSLTKSGCVLNPIVASKLYWAISISSMLYGTEVWAMSESTMIKFEKAHRQMARSIQGLPAFTPDVAVLAILGWVSAHGYTDRKRLMMLWSLVSLPVNNIYKQIFMNRVISYRYGKCNKSKSPMLTLYDTCCKYVLKYEVDKMVDTGVSMPKTVWKRMVSHKIMEEESRQWHTSLYLYSSLQVYRNVILKIAMCMWWVLADTIPHMRQECHSVILLITGGCTLFHDKDPYIKGNICQLCDVNVKDSVEHFMYVCTALNAERLELLNEVAMHAKSDNFIYLSIEEKWAFVLAPSTYDGDDWTLLASIVAKHIHGMVVRKRLLFKGS